MIFLIFLTSNAAHAGDVDNHLDRVRGFHGFQLKREMFDRQRVSAADASKARKEKLREAYEEARRGFKRRPWSTQHNEAAYLARQEALLRERAEIEQKFAQKQKEINKLIEKVVIPLKNKEYQLGERSNDNDRTN